jgi:hypothetical protein
MNLSPLLLVRQKFPDRRLTDIPSTIRLELTGQNMARGLARGSRIAIGVGSRGINNIDIIVKSVVAWWKEQGMNPFLFPAMGSHGAATAQGQADVLAHYGITEATMGCPVVSQLEVVPLGRTAEGIEAFMDKEAYSSDGVMLVGRVKWHTDFAGGLESGLFKMMAIGLGKFAGAQRYHAYAYRIGMERVIRNVGRQVLQSGKILGGLAVLEDAHHNTAQLTAVPVDNMEQREEELLALTKSWMARIPAPVDILIVDEMGKNISGAGMDTKVINRSVVGGYNPWDTAPAIERVYVRDLTELSYNNAVGLGVADAIHDRLLNKIDWIPTHINGLTASAPPAVRTPMHFPTDRQCLEKLWPTVGKFDIREVTLAWITNTMELSVLALSENLRAEIERNAELEILDGPRSLLFQESGDIPNLSEWKLAVGAPAAVSV